MGDQVTDQNKERLLAVGALAVALLIVFLMWKGAHALNCMDRKCPIGEPISERGECWCWIRAERVPWTQK